MLAVTLVTWCWRDQGKIYIILGRDLIQFETKFETKWIWIQNQEDFHRFVDQKENGTGKKHVHGGDIPVSAYWYYYLPNQI